MATKKKRVSGLTRSMEKDLLKIRISAMLRRNMRNCEIAKKLGIASCTVTSYVKEIRADYKQILAESYEDHLERECAKLELVEREAWKGWERSRHDAVTVKDTISDGPDGERKRETTVKGQSGDPRFLAEVVDCISRRAKLLGVDTADKDTGKSEQLQVMTVVVQDKEDLNEYRTWKSLKERLEHDTAN